MPLLQNRPILALVFVGLAALAAVIGLSTNVLVEKRHIKVVNVQLKEKDYDPTHPALYERVYHGIEANRPDIPVDAPLYERKLHNNIVKRGHALDVKWESEGKVNPHADAALKDLGKEELRYLREDIHGFLETKRREAQREEEVATNRALRKENAKEARFEAAAQRRRAEEVATNRALRKENAREARVEATVARQREEEVMRNRALRKEKARATRREAAGEQDAQDRAALEAGETRRKLAHGHPLAPALHDQVYQGLVAKGHDPQAENFERKLRNTIARRAEGLEQRKEREARREQRAMVEENLKNKDETWIRKNNAWQRQEEVDAAAAAAGIAMENFQLHRLEDDYAPLTVCDRPADVGSTEDFETLQKYAQCPEITKDKPILMLEGMQSHGRTGNNLIEFLHAQQWARDQGLQLGVRAHSWATHLLTKMWLAIDGDDWAQRFERAFCVKMFSSEEELEGWDVVHHDTKELFYYRSNEPLGDYISSQEYSLRTLFRNYNTGEGRDRRGQFAKDMCSGIDALFGEHRKDAIYSVIHSRSLEGEPGFRLLRNVSRKSGCDPVAALEMRPDYIKSILGPLGMLNFPIAFITDGQNSEVLERLQADPEIGPTLRVVTEEASWVGGDMSIGIMSNVFIGNPASSFTGFIAKARLALGFGHNYLFRAKDENGFYQTVCGDHCIFDKTIMGVMS